MRIRLQDGREFEGTPRQILGQMWSLSIFITGTLAGYVEWLANSLDVALDPSATLETRCATLVDQLLRRGLAEVPK